MKYLWQQQIDRLIRNRWNIQLNCFCLELQYFLIFLLTFINRSRISQLKIPGFSFFMSSMRFSISGVATKLKDLLNKQRSLTLFDLPRGLLPPITPGLIEPVSWYRFKIFETHPCETLSCREMTQGRTPLAASSTIFSLMWLGSGRPLINTPPSWIKFGIR